MTLFQKLHTQASKLLGEKKITRDVSIGRVACAVQTKSGKVYSGMNVKAQGNLGWCAEVTVLAEALKDGESEIVAFLGIGDDEAIIPPCGACRELLYQVDRKNVNASIFFSDGHSKKLGELLPDRWQEHWSGREEED